MVSVFIFSSSRCFSDANFLLLFVAKNGHTRSGSQRVLGDFFCFRFFQVNFCFGLDDCPVLFRRPQKSLSALDNFFPLNFNKLCRNINKTLSVLSPFPRLRCP